jgi:putative ATP-dependent endonuclease of the OLD family
MRIHFVHIENFRGIKRLDWQLDGRIACLIGPGNAGKSTILDAIELAILPRWYAQLSDDDFFNGDTNDPITVEVTVGDLPSVLVRDDRLGMHLRGWHAGTGLHDEPDDDTTPALTIRFRLDASLEPSWTVVTDRTPDGVSITAKDREKLGVARLGQDADRQLTWMRGSALPRLGSKSADASEALAAASRAARAALQSVPPTEFGSAATAAHTAAQDFGAMPAAPYTPQLGGGATIGLGAMELFEGSIPVRMSGLGSRRLVALGIQHAAVRDGAILLIDEVETGLEPHRIARLLAKIEERSTAAGHSILTTHSPVVIRHLSTRELYVVITSKTATEVVAVPAGLQDVVRSVPEALLARRILVCEGRTEHGLMDAIRPMWETARTTPLAHVGGTYVYGQGSSGTTSPMHAQKLAKLGYAVALLGDADVATTPSDADLGASNVNVIRWADSCNVEERCARDLPLGHLQALVDIAVETFGSASVVDSVGAQLGTALSSASIKEWLDAGIPEDSSREAIGKVAHKRKWFKSHEDGRRLGEVIVTAWEDLAGKDLRSKLEAVEAWFYA